MYSIRALTDKSEAISLASELAAVLATKMSALYVSLAKTALQAVCVMLNGPNDLRVCVLPQPCVIIESHLEAVDLVNDKGLTRERIYELNHLRTLRGSFSVVSTPNICKQILVKKLLTRSTRFTHSEA